MRRKGTAVVRDLGRLGAMPGAGGGGGGVIVILAKGSGTGLAEAQGTGGGNRGSGSIAATKTMRVIAAIRSDFMSKCRNDMIRM